MNTLPPSMSIARTYKDEQPDIDNLEYSELKKLAGEIDGINGRQDKDTLKKELKAHYGN